jgi:hypothetical protein
MKQGQTTLEYILLIGLFAAGLIAMLVYVGRGHQGNLRSQAEQLGANQYAPGKTTINNNETKIAASTNNAGSSTTTVYGSVNEPNPGYCDPSDTTYCNKDLYNALKDKTKTKLKDDQQICTDKQNLYKDVVIVSKETQEGLDYAAAVASGAATDTSYHVPDKNDVGSAAWMSKTLNDTCNDYQNDLDTIQNSDKDWADHQKSTLNEDNEDKTSSSSWSNTTGNTSDHQHTDETLGDL